MASLTKKAKAELFDQIVLLMLAAYKKQGEVGLPNEDAILIESDTFDRISEILSDNEVI